MKLLYSGLLLFLLICASANAQRSHPISGNFTTMRFDEVVEAIEKQSPYRFFYDKCWTDSLTVNIRVESTAIGEILDEIFRGTVFHFAIDPDYSVFITREREILSELPPGFFGES